MITCAIKKLRLFSLGILCGLNLGILPALAQEDMSISVLPGGYAAVKGDTEKFRAHRWLNEGYFAGLESFTLEKTLPDAMVMSFEGSTIPQRNDAAAAFSLSKESVGTLEIDYDMFRKFYDGTGGVYNRFTTLSINDLDEDLHLDISHFGVGITPMFLPEEFPQLSFSFERHVKDGRKSRLTWTAVKEGTTTRNIGPSWQDVDETTDTFALTANKEIGGFAVAGEQRWEILHSNLMREERNLSTTATAADKKIRRQYQEPEADIMTTLLKGERWFLDEKSFVSLAYRYYQADNSELETLAEYDATGVPRSFTSPKNKPGASAENEYRAHSWVGNLVTNLTPVLNFISKFKAELVRRNGDSLYPDDSTDPPDNIANTYEHNIAENKVYRLGESLGLRYAGIPKTSLYAEVEADQSKNWLTEELYTLSGQSVATTAGNFYRETVTNTTRQAFTIGGRVVPSSHINLTTQIRRRMENNDYDDLFETYNSGSARSAFIDALQVNANEANSRVGWKPVKWFEGAFRYQYLQSMYNPRVENQAETKNKALSHIFTYDIMLYPADSLLMNFSFSRQDFKVFTRAGSVSSSQVPGFNADINNWLFSLSYTPKETLTFTNAFHYSQSDNFDDFSATGLPLGNDSDFYDITTSLKWLPSNKVAIEPHYAYYNYNTNPLAEVGDYSAHVAWLEVSYDWF